MCLDSDFLGLQHLDDDSVSIHFVLVSFAIGGRKNIFCFPAWAMRVLLQGEYHFVAGLIPIGQRSILACESSVDAKEKAYRTLHCADTVTSKTKYWKVQHFESYQTVNFR